MCESVWKAGLPVKADPVNEVVTVRPAAMMCAYKFQGKFLLIDVAAMRREDFLEFTRSSLLTKPPPIEPATRGVYTWIVYSAGRKAHQFAALKTRSFLELGTLHRTIVALTGATKVHAAGEFQITESPSYELNFESGSFMRSILRPEDSDVPSILTAECGSDAYAEFVRQKLKAVFPAPFEFKTGSFITTSAKLTAITQEELDLYRSYGARIESYATKEECFKAKGAGRKTRRRRGGRLTRSSRVRR